MENLVLLSTKSPILVAPPKPAEILNRRRPSSPILAAPTRLRGGVGRPTRSRPLVASAFWRGSSAGAPQKTSDDAFEKLELQGRISSSSGSEMSTISGSQQLPVPSSLSSIGSPLFWIGVGVGLSALFSMVVAKIKAYAMQQIFKTMMSQQAPQNGQFSNAAFSPGSPFPFAAASLSSQTASSTAPVAPQPVIASQTVLTVDVPATNEEVTSPTDVRDETAKAGPKKFYQIGLTPEEVIYKIMANPQVALAFQNPRVQAAIMDCSQNPFSITKYQNDK